MTTIGTAAEPLPFTAAHKLNANSLAVGYRVRNSRADPVLLFNVLWEIGEASYDKAPMPAYVCLRDEVLYVAHQILPNPKKKVELRIVPYVTRLAPGAEHAARFEFPLPVQEYNVYYPPDSRKTKKQQVMAKGIVVTLQYMIETPAVKLNPTSIPNSFRVEHPNLFAQVETVRSPRFAMDVPVDKRLDPFEAF